MQMVCLFLLWNIANACSIPLTNIVSGIGRADDENACNIPTVVLQWKALASELYMMVLACQASRRASAVSLWGG
jgi:hypothetical protein